MIPPNGVAGRLRLRGGDRHLRPNQRIHQGGLAQHSGAPTTATNPDFISTGFDRRSRIRLNDPYLGDAPTPGPERS